MIIVPTNKVLLLGWESVAESQEKGFLDFDFITWMALDLADCSFLYFYCFMFNSNGYMGKKRSWRKPKKRKLLVLDTTRGDRLFISLLSSCIYSFGLVGISRYFTLDWYNNFFFICNFCI